MINKQTVNAEDNCLTPTIRRRSTCGRRSGKGTLNRDLLFDPLGRQRGSLTIAKLLKERQGISLSSVRYQPLPVHAQTGVGSTVGDEPGDPRSFGGTLTMNMFLGLSES